MEAGNTPPHAAHGDIAKAELLAILDRLVEAKCGLSEIYRLLDKAKSMAEIRARFARWQATHAVRTSRNQ